MRALYRMAFAGTVPLLASSRPRNLAASPREASTKYPLNAAMPSTRRLQRRWPSGRFDDALPSWYSPGFTSCCATRTFPSCIYSIAGEALSVRNSALSIERKVDMRAHRIFLSFAIAMGCGITLQSTAFSQEYRGTWEQQQACTPDVWRLCGAQIPDVDRIVACLRRNTPQLSDRCRAVFEQGDNAPRRREDRDYGQRRYDRDYGPRRYDRDDGLRTEITGQGLTTMTTNKGR